ncbi:MAG: hypothetical protein IKA36_06880, partial [Clostridia bacterium]|nr:hypothetical protein [Clostridia bacterium]
MIDLKLNEDVDSIFSIEDHYEAIERYMLLENELTELDCELSKKETALNNLLLFKECVDAIGWTPSIEFLIGNQITENDLDDACENLSSSLFKTKLKLSSMFAKVTDTGTSVLKSYLLKFQKIDSSELSSIPDKIRKALAAGESDERDGFRIVSLAGY